MRFMGLAAMAGCVLTITLTRPAHAQTRETETVNRTVTMPENGTLRLRNFSGQVRITAGSGRDVVINAVRRAERSRLDHIKLDISTSGSTVTIEANRRDPNWNEDKDNVVETDFQIQVPAAAALDVKVFSSDVTITGVTGRQTLETFSGDITVTGAASAVKAKTFDGAIEVDATAAGSNPEIDADTFDGRIRAKVAESAKGSVAFDSFGGDFNSDLPLSVRTTPGSRRRLTGDLPAGAGKTLRFHTFGGDVRLTK